jgi:methenyltetrahydrofolate cyclohydrolase
VNEGMRTILEQIASDAPTPGGGSVSALAGALGGALTAMVWRLTAQKRDQLRDRPDGAAPVDPGELERLVGEADAIRERLLAGFSRDAESYEEVLRAFRLPKESDEQKAARREAIEAAMQSATLVPLQNAELCLQALRLARRAVVAGYQPSVTDAGVGLLLAHAGVTGCLYNVELNLVSVKDRDFIERVGEEADRLRLAAREAADSADRTVLERIRA